MALINLNGVLGQATNYTNDATGLTEFQNEWLTAADNQGITINGTSTATFNSTGSADLSLLNYSTNPDLNLSNLNFAITGQAGNDTFGNIAGIGVADSYDGWWNDATKVRAEINYNPNNGESQVLTFKWGPNQSVTSALIDLSLFAPKSGEKYGDEVGFLQAFKDGKLVDINATRVGGGLASSIDNSGIGVKFTADDATNYDYKFQISNADFDELRFTARPYANPTGTVPVVNGIITDSSDYLVQKIDYTSTVNQPVIQFSAPQFSVREDGTPILAVTVVRSGGLEGPASATINLTNGTAVAPGDYNNTPITVNFADGQTSQVITVPVVNDGIPEPTETVNLSLVNPSPGAVIGPQGNAVLNIIDPPTLQFSNPQYVVNEDGTPILAVTVVRSGDTSGAVSATVNLSNGTATTPADYNNTPITVNFAPGVTSQVVNVPIVDDTLVEPTETVNLALVNPTGGAIVGTQNTAVLNILDNDVPPPAKPVVFVAALDPTAGEPGLSEGNGTFQFVRTGGDITQPLTIQYTTTGTATPGADYGALTGTVTIAAGQSVSAPVTVTPVTDGINEPGETVTVKILEDLPYQVGSADTATVQILNNDPLTGTPANNGRVLRYNSSGVFQQSYNTITDAVVGATANDIIVPQAGFYAEINTITIDKPLTIRGTNAGVSPGTGSSVSQTVLSTAPGLPVFTVLPGVNNVTIEGMTIQLGGENGIRLQGVSNNLVIRQNVFNGLGPANGGVIFLDTGVGGGSMNVIDNLIRDVSTTAGSTTSGLQAFRFDTARITDNVIANLTGPGIAADAITNPASIITNNKVTNAGEQGIQFAGGNATIENNQIADTNISQGIDRAGIRLRDSGFGTTLLGTVNVRGNLITNSYNGVAIRNGTNIPNTVTLNYNNLIGNTNAALYHGGTGNLDATNNWWDDITGPVVGGTGRNAIILASTGTVTSSPFSTTVF
ncbi:right-handed parallel beta-helix repeat-containing protein [Phormidium sp. LEGE 05292]|uniref:Calx-beta domain-containing protein n=1 Tax=[Phormidium] sp. LEGE 05292 TaxID=767427 RepID=UPI001881A036|nr:Calx-beta domain-containing protein [Phormidium sp. LEGE 05292]MBE9226609.1 right-handed parallel beta-helix repeat-containing protein [Phormidium sp. LEGE 05292]